MNKIAIFASGRGSNATKIMQYFEGHDTVEVKWVVSNKATAGVLDSAADFGVSAHVISRSSFYESEEILSLLAEADLIVLAGFLWLIPSYLVTAFPNKIVNIHPALLPKYGGKGMYGMNVHKAVKAAQENQSGISIHYVNEQYDEGQIIFQASCELTEQDSAEDIAKKVLSLEHQHFAPTIEQLLL